MIIPKNETRNFHHFLLNNKIPVVIIQDNKLEKNTFALKVNVGFFQDNQTYGLAHFLEHMIFMGSKKYPEENYFNKKLNLANGSTNAYTASNKTVYYFDSISSHFFEMIDIFYNLIKDPLLSEEAVSREIQAVNNEHNKNILSEHWRTFRLLSILADETHPMNTFGTGNLETLTGKYPKLREFFLNHYHPENFSIVISTKNDIIQLKNLLNQTFGTLKKEKQEKEENKEKEEKQNKKEIKLSFPFNKNLGKRFYLKPSNESNLLHLFWTLPTQFPEENAILLIEKLFLDDSFDSISKKLIQENLINLLDWSFYERNQDFTLINLKLVLTKKGINYVPELISMIFNYLNNLSNLDENEIQRYLEEYQEILNLEFNYSDKDDTDSLVKKIIDNISEYPIENLLNYRHTLNNISPKLFRKIIKNYLVQDKTITLELYPKITPEKYLIEEFYKLEYLKISDKILITKNKEENIILPKKNQFIPKNIQVYRKLDENIKTKLPFIIRFNHSWNTPKITLSILINSEILFDSPLNYLKTILWTKILNYHLDNQLADLINVGYTFSTSFLNNRNLLILQISGWNQNWDKVIARFFSALQSKPDNYLFNLINQENKEQLRRMKYIDSWSLIEYLKTIKLIKTEYHFNDLLKTHYLINLSDYQNLTKSLLTFNYKIYLYGNYYDENVIINSILKYSNLSNKNFTNFIYPIISFPIKNQNFNHLNEKEKHKVIKFLFYLGKNTLKNEALLNLTSQLLQEDFFNEIRTKKQLGYLVGLNKEQINDDLFISQKIQNHQPLKTGVKHLLEYNHKILERINPIEFEKTKENLIKDLTKPEEDFSQIVSQDIMEIISNKFNFNRKKELAKIVEILNFDQIKSYINSIFQKPIIYFLE
jgi:insulysin